MQIRPIPVARHHPGKPPNAGFSLLEVAVALAVVSVGLMGFSKAILDTMVLNQMNKEGGIARRAVKQVLSDIEATTFSEAFARFNATAADDLGAGQHMLGAFAVDGLRTLDGDVDGLAGEILFPDDVSFAGALELREDLQDPSFGMLRDLNLDGVIDSENHADDYNLLPVRVRVQWFGRGGPAKVEFTTVLIEP